MRNLPGACCCLSHCWSVLERMNNPATIFGVRVNCPQNPFRAVLAIRLVVDKKSVNNNTKTLFLLFGQCWTLCSGGTTVEKTFERFNWKMFSCRCHLNSKSTVWISSSVSWKRCHVLSSRFDAPTISWTIQTKAMVSSPTCSCSWNQNTVLHL